MGSSKKIIAIIPARGNSKSIKFKNLLKINNKSLIQICYETLKKNKNIDEIYCTTENSKILNHCKKIGLNSIKRPKKLSSDNSNVYYAISHALKKLKKLGKNFDIVLLAQPTSPFFSNKQIELVLENLLNNEDLKSSQTIHATPHNYHYLNTRLIVKKKILFKFNKMREIRFNKQKKDKTFNFGNLCAVKIDDLNRTKNFFCKPAGFVKIDRFSSFDIDNKDDIQFLNKISYLFKK